MTKRKRVGRFLVLLLFMIAIVLSGCGTPTGNSAAVPLAIDDRAEGAFSVESQPDDASANSTKVTSADDSAATTSTESSKKTALAENSTKSALAENSTATTSSSDAPDTAHNPEPAPNVTISIVGDEEKGTILEPAAVDWQEGETVLDVLKRVARSMKIPIEHRGIGMFAYVEGIGNLYEFDRGPGSGWQYKVNGEFAKKSAGAVKVNRGDAIEWTYSVKLDEDSNNTEQ